jgi:hypothetical protein
LRHQRDPIDPMPPRREFEERQETSPQITFLWFPSLSFSSIELPRSARKSFRKTKSKEEDTVASERRRQALRSRLKDCEEAVQMDRAARVKATLERLESARGTRAHAPEEKQKAKRTKSSAESQSAETRHRLHHLELAIENLHSAGLHEQAESLVKQAERMRQRVHPQMDAPSTPSAPMDELRAEARDIREAVQELQRQMREMRQRGR